MSQSATSQAESGILSETPRPRSVMDGISATLTSPKSIWMYLLLFLAVVMIASIIANDLYREAFEFLVVGVEITLLVAVSAFILAQLLGLITALARVSYAVSQPTSIIGKLLRVVTYNIATFYVEVVRGIPIIVQLIYMAFVIFPALVSFLNLLGDALANEASLSAFNGLGKSLAALTIRDMSMEIRAIIGLAIAYGAYEAEVYRAGIESIDKGQMEAARSLGMSYFQAMRYVILPQAIRRVLPPIGNDFVAMLKDSSLVSVLAVNDLTHKGDLHRARTFRTFETWNTVTFLYLIMTIGFSRVVRYLERRLSPE